jgi:ribosomal protein S18 acetylase RimI-like enzyme
MIHVGVRDEALVRELDPAWPGGPQGYVAFLYVEPAYRRKGLGDDLWHRGLERLGRTRQVVLDGQCLSPFYGNSEGPFTPFWGTPEGPAVDWDDSGTKKFLARKGFAPRFRALQMSVDLAVGPDDFLQARKAARRVGVALEERRGEIPEVGQPPEARRAVLPGLDFSGVAAVRRGRTVGTIVFYPMKELGPGRFAIYEASVSEAFRGKALGRHLLGGALAWMRARKGATCEVLAVPEVSETAFRLYQAAGFQTVAKWAIY